MEDLDKVRAGLVDEISMLRVTVRRVFDHSTDLTAALEEIKRDIQDTGGSPESLQKLSVLSSSLSVLGMATTRLAHMLRTQKFLDGASDDPLEDLVLAAIETLD